MKGPYRLCIDDMVPSFLSSEPCNRTSQVGLNGREPKLNYIIKYKMNLCEIMKKKKTKKIDVGYNTHTHVCVYPLSWSWLSQREKYRRKEHMSCYKGILPYNFSVGSTLCSRLPFCTLKQWRTHHAQAKWTFPFLSSIIFWGTMSHQVDLCLNSLLLFLR